MAANPVTILDRTFPSATKAKKFISGILNRLPLYERISGDDEAYVCAVFHLHPDTAQKLALGEPDYFEVGLAEEHCLTGICFYSVCNGIAEDFSFQKAINFAAKNASRTSVAKTHSDASSEGGEK